MSKNGFNFITHHAAKHIWAYPEQDSQSIQKPFRISPSDGYRNRFNIQHWTFMLPVEKAKFHVFQIGQLDPRYLGLFPIEDKWIRIDDICNRSQMLVNIYTDDGIELPRCKVWYMWTARRNLIFAVQEVKKVGWDFKNEWLYLRVYSNHYFNILRLNMIEDFVKVLSKEIKDLTDVDEINEFYNEWSTKRGHLFILINGIQYKTWRPDLLKAGALVDLFYDSTVYKKITFPVNTLSTFDSTLDNKRKYLLTYSQDGKAWNNTIDYHDDIDLFVSRKVNDNLIRGVYYHRNMGDAVRQVTHRDYSIVTPYVLGYINNNGPDRDHENKKIFEGETDVQINMYIRRGMEDRPLVYNAHKLHELYKLPFNRRKNAFLGVRSNIPEWRAEVLEHSALMEIIRSRTPTYDTEKVVDAYGYHAISKLAGNSPIKVTGRKVEVPHTLTLRSSAWEYDKDGKLLGYYNHIGICDYYLKNKDTKLVEFVNGLAGNRMDAQYDKDEFEIDSETEFRLYRVSIGHELHPEQWEDVTDQIGVHYEIIDKGDKKLVRWISDTSLYTTFYRTDDETLAYEVKKPLDNGIIDFYLSEYIKDDTDVYKHIRMMVPMGHLDVYCNGHALVRGIDYFVDFPRVCITAKNYFKNIELGEKQSIIVRFHGFCKKDLSFQDVEQTGYVQFGKLSYNNRYHLKDDKVLNIIIGGAVYDRENLGFSEDNTIINLPNRALADIEGQPWQIKDLIVPVREFSRRDTYHLRDISKDLDKRISDYMTQFLPEIRSNQYPPIKKLYPLYSPFISYIMDDMVRGTLQFDKLESFYNDQEVLELCKPYEWILNFDPIYNDTAIDYEYVIIHPHPHYHVIDLTYGYYKLLERIVNLYCKGRVKLSHFVRKI